MAKPKSPRSSHSYRSESTGQKRMRGIPIDFNEVKDFRISGAITPTSHDGIEQFSQAYNLKSRNQVVEILGRIIMKLPAEIVLPLIEAELSENNDS